VQRDIVVRYAKRLVPDELATGTAGNLSVRESDVVAITPSGIAYELLTPGDVALVSLDGTLMQGRPSTELPLHLAVYRETASAAVVHTHSPFATALGTVADQLPAIHYLVAELGGPVPVVPYATPGSDDLAQAATAALQGRSAVLLRNHGTLTVGDSLPRAYARAVLLEWLAALYYRARAFGEPSLLSEEELARLAGLVTTYGRR
jgi:L-fuculose-phosphate aldolase